jgi:hypothetical protein
MTTYRKRLHEMDELWDMGRFPIPIYVGATGNILQTIVLTYLLHGRAQNQVAVLPWAVGIVSANVLPVIALRTRLGDTTRYPVIEEMDFWTDQHKFASWVYAIASANMFFWIVLAWIAFSHRRSLGMLGGVLVLAFVCTFFPAWIRLFVPQERR